MKDSRKIELVGKYAATLSLVEVALGSVLHALHLPFSGNFLSLNQGYLLCRVALEAKREGLGRGAPYAVSNVAAVLKSLAPAGKKLGPMLSLSMQGALFSVGTLFLGVNLAGLALGMLLLSVWTFVQPLLTYYLFFGSELIEAVRYLFAKTVPYHGLSLGSLARIAVAVLLFKAALALAVAWLAWRQKGGAGFQERLLRLARERGAAPLAGAAVTRGQAAWLALRDLTRPLFLISLATTLLFLFFSEHPAAGWVWVLLRPVAIGFLFFYFSRTLTLERWLLRLEGTRGESFARACRHALNELRQSPR